MRARDFSLRARLTLLMSLLIAAISVSAGFLILRRIEASGTGAALTTGRAVAEVTAYGVSPALLFDDSVAAAEAIAGACHSHQVERATVYDATGKTFARCETPLLSSAVRRKVEAPVVHQGKTIGRVEITLALQDVQASMRSERTILSIAIIIAAALSVIASFVIGSITTAPVRRIGSIAVAVSEGNTSLRAAITSNDEVGSLARAFNGMLDALQRAHVDLEQLNQSLEDQVAQRTSELTQVLESAYDGILAVDSNGRCTLLNRAALEKFTDLQIGSDAHDALHPRDVCSDPGCALARMIRDQKEGWTKTTVRHRDGTTLSLEISAARIPIDQVGFGLVLTLRDVTEREKLREELDRATRLNSLGQLAAMLAHEFNNVLMGITPFVEIIRRSGRDTASVSHACNVIAQCVARGRRVTQEVLRYTRPVDPSIADFDVRRWLATWSAGARVTLPKTIRLVVDTGTEPLAASGDATQLEQVLTNLTANARDAMNDSGTITISIDRVDEATARWVQITVADDGPGMEAATASRVFEPFYTTKKVGGTGLGLTVVEQLVSRNGGRVELTTAPKKGTTFRVLIPRGTAPAAAADGAVADAIVWRVPKKVLLVEDDQAVAAGLAALLQDEGMTITVAGAGREALDVIKKSLPDVVLLDVGLPDMDGVEVFRQMSVIAPTLPVIFSTGHADARRFAEVLSGANVDFLLKPYDIDTLLGKLAAITGPTSGP